MDERFIATFPVWILVKSIEADATSGRHRPNNPYLFSGRSLALFTDQDLMERFRDDFDTGGIGFAFEQSAELAMELHMNGNDSPNEGASRYGDDVYNRLGPHPVEPQNHEKAVLVAELVELLLKPGAHLRCPCGFVGTTDQFGWSSARIQDFRCPSCGQTDWGNVYKVP